MKEKHPYRQNGTDEHFFRELFLRSGGFLFNVFAGDLGDEIGEEFLNEIENVGKISNDR